MSLKQIKDCEDNMLMILKDHKKELNDFIFKSPIMEYNYAKAFIAFAMAREGYLKQINQKGGQSCR